MEPRAAGHVRRPLAHSTLPRCHPLLLLCCVSHPAQLFHHPLTPRSLAVTLYFVIPRAPSFQFYTDQPFVVNNSTISFSRTPTNFSYTGELQLLADASNSYVPVHFSNIQATVYDLDTDKTIATGSYRNHVMSRKANQPVSLPIEFSYSALNASDTTCASHLTAYLLRPDVSRARYVQRLRAYLDRDSQTRWVLC